VSTPEANPFWLCLLNGGSDHLIGFIPGARLPTVFATLTHSAEWMQEPFGILKNLLDSMPSDAEKPLAVRILLIALKGHKLVPFNGHLHTALGR
jgi:hypothetical protein